MIIEYHIDDDPNVKELRSVIEKAMDNDVIFIVGHPIALFYLFDEIKNVSFVIMYKNSSVKIPLCIMLYKKDFINQNIEYIDPDDREFFHDIIIIKFSYTKYFHEIYVNGTLSKKEAKKNIINTIINEISITWSQIKRDSNKKLYF